MNDIIVIDDFISKDYQDYILRIVNEEDFPLYFRQNIVASIAHGDVGNINGFTHNLYENDRSVSEYFVTLYPMTLNITEKTGVRYNRLDRMRFNFVLGYPSTQHHLPHVDNYTDHYVAIYYVNDCDGDTVIFDQYLHEQNIDADLKIMAENTWTEKKRVSPKKGRLLLFNGRYYHASSFTTNSSYRCVINMNLSLL